MAATTTKLPATPAEVTLRNSIPTATVQSHTATPVGYTADGRRQACDNSHPSSVPLRKGHAVVAMPAGASQTAGMALTMRAAVATRRRS